MNDEERRHDSPRTRERGPDREWRGGHEDEHAAERYGATEEYRGPSPVQDRGEMREFDDYRTRGGYGPRVDNGTRGEDHDRGYQDRERPRSGDFGQDMPRSQQGQFAGRGPKGYRRSDERIQEDINERLTQHPAINAEDIVVAVQDGEVTLTGSVTDRASKRMAEDLAENVFGVKDVRNELRIGQSMEARQ